MDTHRTTAIVATVVLFHAAALWALQSGLLRRMADSAVVLPLMVEFTAAEDATPAQPPRQARSPQRTPVPVAQPQRQRVKVDIALAPSTAVQPPGGALSDSSASRPETLTAASPAKETSPAPATPRLELPSSDADYLHNPKPPYPPLSKRLGEQGTVVIRAFIGIDGTATQASIHRSSGFDRLDQVALATARQWRYVPGARAGRPEPMWFNVPFHFVLE